MTRTFVTVAETPLFVRQATDIWNDTEREAFIDFIAGNPEAGDVISETGGVRKVRWKVADTGKRSGARVIYLFIGRRQPIYLLMIYAKARREDMTAEEKRSVRQLAARLKRQR